MSTTVARSRVVLRRNIGSPVLFAIVYASLAGAVYYSLGVVGAHALGLTPLVFLIAAALFGLNAMTYLEGASMHPEGGGSTVFARYAFNEFVSFVAGWVILLDDVILIAVATFSATQYLRVFWHPLGNHVEAMLLAFAFIALVALNNIRGFAGRSVRTMGMLAVGDVALQLFIVVLGLFLFFDPHTLLDPIHLGSEPTWASVIFALTVTTIALTCVESAAGLAAEVRTSRAALRRLVASGMALLVVVYVGIALVAVTALPVRNGHTALGGRYRDAPVIGIVAQVHPQWLSQTLTYLVGAMATLTLVAAANAAMLGLSRLAYLLSTNRQIPSALGRLHPQRSTPFVLIIIAAVMAAGLVVSENLDLLVGLYAFGAMLAFTIAGASVCRLRYSEPDRDRPFTIPLSISLQGGKLPLPAALATLIFGAGWVAVMVVHAPARYAGLGWLAFGVALYVAYRKSDEQSLLRRVTVSPQMLIAEPPRERDYGSILVPLFGTELDQDIIQTAALLAAGEPADRDAIDRSTIEALWIFEIPMALPLDVRLPEAQLDHARKALARAKLVGEQYAGVQVATATVRARRAGQAIVEEARRRGAEAIVLGAEELSRVRGGRRLGGLGGPLENFVGEVTRYVVGKAGCRVILTALPAERSSDGASSERTLMG